MGRAGHQTQSAISVSASVQAAISFGDITASTEVRTGKADSWWNTVFVSLVTRAGSGSAAAHRSVY